MVDKYFYMEDVTEPGWELQYFHAEHQAYHQLVAPKLETTGLLAFLPKDLHDPTTNYMFRSALRPYFHFAEHTNMVNLAGFMTHLEARAVPRDVGKYYLLYANSCIRERYTSAYSQTQMMDIFRSFISEPNLIKMTDALAAKHQLKNTSPDQVLQDTRELIRGAFATNFQTTRDEVCTMINTLADLVGEPPANCEALFDGPFAPDTDGDFWNNYGTQQADHIDVGYLALYMFFSYLEFPFEHWTEDRIPFSGYGTNHNMQMDLNTPLFTLFNYAESDPEIYEFYRSDYLLHEAYLPISDIPSFPFMADLRRFYNEFCPNQIGPKAKEMTLN